jgi:dUTPase/cell division protein FtsB
MLMSRDEIQSAGLIQNDAAEMYQAASYNLRVGRIILPGGKEAKAYQIPPLGMVRVVSLEGLILPKGILGYATVKTGLSSDGILAINIGLVDPEYRGLISSILINFSKNDYHLQYGDEFLRLTFHQYNAPTGPVPTPSHMASEANYVKEATRTFVEKFSATFLNIEENTRQFLRKELGTSVLKWMPLAAFIIVCMTFFLNFGNTAVATWLAQRSVAQQAQSQTTRDIEQLRNQSAKEIAVLQARIADLEKQIGKIEDMVSKGRAGNASTGAKKTP